MTRPLNAEGREEREGEHHAAELGEHAASRRSTSWRSRPSGPPTRDRPGEQAAERRAEERRDERQLDRAAERLQDTAAASGRRDVVERRRAVRRLECAEQDEQRSAAAGTG